MSARCGSCDAPIVWASTHAGRNMPLDAQPCAEPTSLRAWRDPAGTIHVRDIDGIGSTEIPADARNATSHFATCPNAGQHRRKKQASKSPQCVSVQVDGEPVLARFHGQPTQVRAAKAKFADEGRP